MQDSHTTGTSFLGDVSRETKDRLMVYSELVKKWNPRINLVAKSTLDDLWARHFVDSAQIFYLGGQIEHWVDLGSGGGFPGAVVAILGLEASPATRFTLVESDKRKSAFLRTVSRETGVEFEVITARIEELDPLKADVVSARALASLDRLLSFTELHRKPEGKAIFPKGVSVGQEIAEARKKWNFVLEEFQSETDTTAKILRIGKVSHV